jgi:hypothetical protein
MLEGLFIPLASQRGGAGGPGGASQTSSGMKPQSAAASALSFMPASESETAKEASSARAFERLSD